MRGTANADLVTASLALLLPEQPVSVRLMNTIWADRHGVYDALSTVANLRMWLAAVEPGAGLRAAVAGWDIERVQSHAADAEGPVVGRWVGFGGYVLPLVTGRRSV